MLPTTSDQQRPAIYRRPTATHLSARSAWYRLYNSSAAHVFVVACRGVRARASHTRQQSRYTWLRPITLSGASPSARSLPHPRPGDTCHYPSLSCSRPSQTWPTPFSSNSRPWTRRNGTRGPVPERTACTTRSWRRKLAAWASSWPSTANVPIRYLTHMHLW